jgi:hypothetical protein
LSRRAWRAGLKNPEEVMEILEAFDLTGTLWRGGVGGV